jgi:hypothetical protein
VPGVPLERLEGILNRTIDLAALVLLPRPLEKLRRIERGGSGLAVRHFGVRKQFDGAGCFLRVLQLRRRLFLAPALAVCCLAASLRAIRFLPGDSGCLCGRRPNAVEYLPCFRVRAVNLKNRGGCRDRIGLAAAPDRSASARERLGDRGVVVGAGLARIGRAVRPLDPDQRRNENERGRRGNAAPG